MKMKRSVFYFVIAGMVFILTGCGGDDPLNNTDNPDTPSAPGTFIYTASAGSGGTINPSGSVSIKQGEDRTFTASPNSDRVVDEWRVNGSAVSTSGNEYTVTNVQENGTIQVTFKEKAMYDIYVAGVNKDGYAGMRERS